MARLTLAGRTAIVTGGTRGIGLTISKAFLQAGMNVALLSRSAGGSERVDIDLSGFSESSLCIECDVADYGAVRSAIAKVIDTFGRIDVVVNNAGVVESEPFEQLTECQLSTVLDTNLLGAMYVIQAAIPHLAASEAARVINISSNAGRMGGYASGTAYAASKGGVIAMTYSLARKLASHGILVNCVAPGPILTSMVTSFGDGKLSDLEKEIPLGRLGSPEEVAAAVCFFASEECSFTTGAVLDVNGGLFTG